MKTIVEVLPPLGAVISLPEKVLKSWGHELIYYNKPNYCSKLLYIEAKCETSMHYHEDKHETITVFEGVLELEYINKGEVKTRRLNKNQSVTIPPGFPHRLRAIENNLQLFEASTHSKPLDSIRLTRF